MLYVWSERENKLIKKIFIAEEGTSQRLHVGKPDDITEEEEPTQTWKIELWELNSKVQNSILKRNIVRNE